MKKRMLKPMLGFALTLFILLAVVVSVTVFPVQHIQHTQNKIQSQVDDALDLIVAENWEASQAKVKEIRHYWDDEQDFWEVFVDHRHTDEADQRLAACEIGIQLQNKEDAAASLKDFSVILARISDLEKLELHNIL